MTSSFAHQTDSSAPYSQHHTRQPSKFGYCCKGDDFNRFYRNALNYLNKLSVSCGPKSNYNVVYTTHNISPTQGGGSAIDYTLTPGQVFNSHVIVTLDSGNTDSSKIVGPSSADVLAYFNGNIPSDLFFILIITNATTTNAGSQPLLSFNYTLPSTKAVFMNSTTTGGETKIINVLVKSNGDIYYFPYTN